ncbi:unnamed protein product [Cercopithifilaria johnstoni]|uniref:Uncharacterized protein n=1 Tax=Cercopithifilaria johnstoni TaxID=2874296 RepID=A0A8J2M3W2_9BILA|nr:unnamed protein product [Cercopithifilaria johnstoni]
MGTVRVGVVCRRVTKVTRVATGSAPATINVYIRKQGKHDVLVIMNCYEVVLELAQSADSRITPLIPLVG